MGVEGAAVQVKDDGRITYRASSLGTCTKMLVAERMGYDLIDPRGEKALAVIATMNKGHEAEDVVVRSLAQRGIIVNDRDGEIALEVTGNISVVGHWDGMTTDWAIGQPFGVEIKSLSNDEFAAFWKGGTPNYDHGRWPINCWQISAYMVASRLPFAVITYNRDTGEMRDDEWWEPKMDLTSIRQRVLEIERQARTFALPSICDTPQFPCPVFYLHESDRLEFEDEDNGVVQALAETYEKAKNEKAMAEKVFAAAQKALLKAVGRTGKFETLQGWKVTAFDPGKGALDREKVIAFIEANGGDVEEFKQMGLRVTPPKEKE